MKNYQVLLERQKDLQEEISLLSSINKDSAKKLVSKLQEELAEIESTIQQNQKAIDLSKITDSSEFKSINGILEKLFKQQSIDYNARAYFDYSFSNGTVSATIRPATIRASKDSVIVRNSKPLPAEITVHLGKEDKPKTFKRTADISVGTEFASWESFLQSYLNCFGKLYSEYTAYNSEFKARENKPSRFDSASAKTGKLQRLTKNSENLPDYADSEPIGKDKPHTEAASSATMES